MQRYYNIVSCIIRMFCTDFQPHMLSKYLTGFFIFHEIINSLSFFFSLSFFLFRLTTTLFVRALEKKGKTEGTAGSGYKKRELNCNPSTIILLLHRLRLSSRDRFSEALAWRYSRGTHVNVAC